MQHGLCAFVSPNSPQICLWTWCFSCSKPQAVCTGPKQELLTLTTLSSTQGELGPSVLVTLTRHTFYMGVMHWAPFFLNTMLKSPANPYQTLRLQWGRRITQLLIVLREDLKLLHYRNYTASTHQNVVFWCKWDPSNLGCFMTYDSKLATNSCTQAAGLTQILSTLNERCPLSHLQRTLWDSLN